MPDVEDLVANLREDIDLLAKDSQPTPEEMKILNDLSGVLAMLENAEPESPAKCWPDGHADTWYYTCGKCFEPIDLKDKYCRYCGRAVKWSE